MGQQKQTRDCDKAANNHIDFAAGAEYASRRGKFIVKK
jgi:hypothetical protein